MQIVKGEEPQNVWFVCGSHGGPPGFVLGIRWQRERERDAATEAPHAS